MDYTVSDSFLNKWKKKKDEEEKLTPADYGVSKQKSQVDYSVSDKFIDSWKNGTRYKTDLEEKQEEKRKKAQGLKTLQSYLTPDTSDPMWYAKQATVSPHVKGSIGEGLNFRNVARTILGVEYLDGEVDPNQLLQAIQTRRDGAKDKGENLKYRYQYDQLLTAAQADLLASTKMDGQNHSVLEEMQLLTNLSGGEKKKRKSAVLKKMEELGVNPDNYALFTDDTNYTVGNTLMALGGNLVAGVTAVEAGFTNTLDVTVGNILKGFGWENNPVSKLNDYYRDIADIQAYEANLYAEQAGGGGVWKFTNEGMQGLGSAVPYALMSFMGVGAGAGTATTSTLTTNAAMQSGNFLTKAGITASTMAKNPQFWTSVASTLGNEYEDAKKNGAPDAVAAAGAVVTSLVNAGIEIGFDGGSGIQGLADDLASGNKKKVWALLESAFEEGGEEGLQKFVNETVTKVVYNHDADVYNPEEYAREMAIGTFAGLGLGSAQTAVQAGVNAYDKYQANKLTADEQAVVNKVTEMLIAQEQEKSKNELSNSEKKKIAKTARMLVEKGYVKADTIESVLGGESYEAFKGELQSFIDSDLYKQWKSAEKGEKDLPKLQEEYDKLYKMENGKKSDEMRDRQAELLKQIEAIKNAPKSADLKAQLDIEAVRVQDALSKVRNEVYKRVKGSRLAESYRELIRSKEKFAADPAKYDNEYSRQTVQNILNSGLGDGSNQFRDTVEFLARISADQESVIFDLTDTDGIKEAGHYKEGYVTNGYVTDDGKITLNYDSPNMLESIVGHEITHVLEKAGNYKALRQAVFDYAISKEGLERFNARIKAAEEAYKGKTNTSPEGEVAADLIGEYLFTDYNFISNLAKTDMNGFQRFWDGVKHLYKMAVAGSKEARQLEKVKHMFEKAYNENLKGKVKPKAETEVGTEESKLSMSEELTPSQAQMMNIFVSNITNVASRNGISLRDFYIATSDINAFGMTKADAKMTADLLQPIVDQLGIENYQGYLDKMRSFAEEDSPGNVEGQKNTTAKGGVKYDLKKDASGNTFVDVTEDIFDSNDGESIARTIQKVLESKFKNLIEMKGQKFQVNKTTNDEFRRSESANKLLKRSPVAYNDKLKTIANADEILEAAKNWIGEATKHTRKDDIVEFGRGNVMYRVGENGYVADVLVGIRKNGAAVLYDLVNIYETNIAEAPVTVESKGTPQRRQDASAGANLPQSEPGVKGKFSYSSIANSFFEDETLSTDEFLSRDYHETEFYKQYTDQCINNMRQTMEGFDESKVDEYRESIRKQLDGIVEVAVAMKQAGYDIRDTMTVDENGEQKVVPLDGIQDSKKRSLFTSLEPNSDYITSHDISTICDKRKNFAEIYDEIVRIEEAKGVPKGKRFFDNVNNYFAIHKIMADKGLTTPCRQCYVESMRKNLAPMATAFLELVQETDPNNTANAQLYHQKGKDKGKVKESNESTREFVLSAMAEHPEYNLSAEDLTIEMLTTEDGLAQLRIQAPLIYEAFNSFYGQAKPKMPKSATPFRFGELTAMLTDSRGKVKKGLIEKINSTGGFRLQSYSDFQIQNYADVLQVLFEAGTLGLNGHAYTKVPAFLDATEGTNLKRNISIFMYKDGDEWKLDRNDSFPYSLEEIYELVKNDKTGNTSIIAVSQNREMSAWIMANDLVGYGIPFHKSGLKMATVRDTIVRTEDGREVKGYTGTIDHTKQQTEVYKSNVYDEEGKLVSKANTKVKKGIDIYNDLWDFENKEGLSRNELIKKNLMAYIDKCEELGYRPKFREYVMNNGGVLNDVLRFAKELGFADENATIDDISFEYKDADGNVLYRVPYGYYKFLGDFGMFTPDGKAAPQKPLSLEGYDFENAKKFFSDAESLRRTEILQQFANGTIRDGYRDSEMSTEDLENLAAQKRTEVAHEALGIEEDIAPVAEDIAPVGNGAKLSMSKAEDVGYHAGDLGKAEGYWDMAANSRSTGHFGTGTYFVGDKARLEGYNSRNGKPAPIETVDFGKYNLFRPLIESDGLGLHRGLQYINDNISNQPFATMTFDEMWDAKKRAEDAEYTLYFDDDATEADKEKARAAFEDLKNEFGEIGYDPDKMDGEALYEKLSDIRREYRSARMYLESALGHDLGYDGVEEKIDAVIRSVYEDVSKIEDSYSARYEDSPSTRFMKAFGYEGIDVRRFKGLDNTTYGSVIYDLKGEDLARKQEIGTAKFSMSKADTDYMNAINSDDLEAVELMVEEFAKSAGYDTRMFHETDAENIHIFDISRGTHGGTDYQTPYGIFTKTSPKNIGLGSKQMSLFVKAHNTLRVENRDDVVNKVPGFAAYYDQITEIDKKYDALANELEDEEFDALMEWMEEHPDADMDVVFPNSYIIEGKPADIDSAKYLEAHKKRTDVMAEWSAKYDAVAVKAKAFITDYLRSNGYDSMYFAIDGGSRGRQTDSLIVLDENQVKSAAPVTYDDNGNIIPLSQRFNAESDDTRYSLSPEAENQHPYGYYPTKDNRVYNPLDEFAPVRKDVAPKTDVAPAPATVSNTEMVGETAETEQNVPEEEDVPIQNIQTVNGRLTKRLENSQAELARIEQLREESKLAYDKKIADAQAKLDGKKNKDSKVAIGLKKRIEKLKRLQADIDAGFEKRISDINKRIDRTMDDLRRDHTEADRYAKAKARIDAMLEHDKAALIAEYDQRKAELADRVADKDAYIAQMARNLYDELRGLRKGVRASDDLASLLDAGLDWGNLKSALSNVRYNPAERVNANSVEESAVRQLIEESYENDVYSIDDLDAELDEKIKQLETDAEAKREQARTATTRKEVDEELTGFWQSLIGDTSTWKDLPWGIMYKTKTLRRILRTVVRDPYGKPNIELADKIYDALETKYDTNEAELKRESRKLKKFFVDLKMTRHEDIYAHMLGELRYNPDSELSQATVDEYYEKHKKKIDLEKVNKAIEESRRVYDELFERVNTVLRKYGMKEIEYRQGYFPHFDRPAQSWLAKALNWKSINNEIPTSIAGKTQDFKPKKSYQSFDKHREGDLTSYSLYEGLDMYIHGALDWIHHIGDIQSRRALENWIRYEHSNEGVKQAIAEVKANEYYNADQMQEQIDLILAKAENPLGGFVREMMNRTNTLANKKSSMDREMEDLFSRKAYTTMTNLNGRVNANMVVGSFTAAIANIIPVVQSWHMVSPVFTVQGLRDLVKSSVIIDDGIVDKSTFLTNRLRDEEALYQTGWDKAINKAAFMMSAFDNITSQTVWRSKYLQNLHEGMSENAAIQDADQFAKNLMAGRSRGNMPSIFDAKNPVIRAFTSFQLEVANQYGFMFEDVPQDSVNKARLVKGFATAFFGAYMYNMLTSALTGRDSAFDPIGIIEDFFKDLFDDDDDDEDDAKEALFGLGENIVQEVPFVGGFFGGGRIPISSALPYGDDSTPIRSLVSDVEKATTEGEYEAIVKELLKPLYYLVLPAGGGQIKKTNEGIAMFDPFGLKDLPVTGSYTTGGDLRFPVEATFGNVAQAAVFGQYANKNAREYFDNGYAPLGNKQVQEWQDVDIPISNYWKYRKGLSGLKTAQEKADYINGLNLPIRKKNILINNQLDRKEPIDMRDYDDYGSLEEFDFAQKNPEKYDFFSSIGVGYQDYKNANEEEKDAYNWAFDNPEKYALSKAVTNDLFEYKKYTSDLGEIRADKDANGKSISGSAKEKKKKYIFSLDIDMGAKFIMYKDAYPSVDDYNDEIIEYLNFREDLTYDDRIAILKELGFTVRNGRVYYD